MKRFLALLLVSIMTISILGGCSSTKETADEPDTKKEEQTKAPEEKKVEKKEEAKTPDKQETITIEIFPDLWPEKMVESLELAGYDDIVEFRETPQNQYENKIRMMIAGGTIGDIICIDAPNIAYYASMGALEPLDNYWAQEDFDDLVNASKTAVTWNNQKWAAPLNESNVVLYYNKEMFAEEGIEPAKTLDESWTFEQLLDAAEKLTKRDGDGNITRYGLLPTMFTPNNRNEGMTYTQMLWTWWAGAEVLSPDGTEVDGYFNSEENRRALQYFYDLHNTYKVSPTEDMQSGFAGEKIAMWINGPWMTNVWESDFPEFMDKWGAMPLPHDKAYASGAGSWNMSLTKQGQNKDLAYKVLESLTNEQGTTLYCTKTKNIPARKSVLEAESMFSEGHLWEIINAQVMNNSKARPSTPVYPQISEALMDCYNALALGQDVDTAMEEAVNKMKKALR